MSEHAWVRENLAAHLAGGLDDDERTRIESHLADCAECAASLESAQAADERLMALFAPVQPGPALEDRMVRSFRRQAAFAQRTRFISSKWFKVVAAAAAACFIALIGLGVTAFLEGEGFFMSRPFADRTPRQQREDEVAAVRKYQRDTPLSAIYDDSDSTARQDHQRHYAATEWSLEGKKGKELADGTSNTTIFGDDGRLKTYTELSKELRNGDVLMLGDGKAQSQNNLHQLSLQTTLKDKSKDLGVDPMAEETGKPGHRAGSSVAGGATPDPKAGWSEKAPKGTPQPVNKPPMQSAYTGQGNFGGGGRATGGFSGGFGGGGGIGGNVNNGYGTRSFGPAAGLPNPQFYAELDKQRLDFKAARVDNGSAKSSSDGLLPPLAPVLGLSVTPDASRTPPPPPDGHAPSAGGGSKAGGDNKAEQKAPEKGGEAKPGEPRGEAPGDNKKPADDGYYKPGESFKLRITEETGKAERDAREVLKDMEERLAQAKEGGVKKSEDGEKQGKDKGEEGDKFKANDAPPAVVAQQPKQDPQPAAPQKMIIRTGEVEYEVESFDAAMDKILELITKGTKGGYTGDTNRKKLANGKMQGYVVVRVPPAQLDDFLKNLRDSMQKMGAELRGQRITSQDVTKTYTDLQSHLKGAKAMEERLLNMIKNGKGEIKDLLLAEKELGVWRTKIEELQGEINYYANQVSLSTITVTLTEREINVAAKVERHERVLTAIEVDDVAQAKDEVQAAVAEAKGRLTRSELRQAKGGQIRATLEFEVPPAQAATVRNKLRKLGILSSMDIDQVQSVAVGTQFPKNGKEIVQGNTRFEVELFDVSNLQPRETVTVRVVAFNVAEAFRKLRETVDKAKGVVRRIDVREQGKIGTEFWFDVYRVDEGKVHASLTEAGEILLRHAARSPEGPGITDQKVAFRVTLDDLSSVEPRETVTTRIVAQDVGAAFAKLRDLVTKLKGRLINVDLKDQQYANGQLDFDVKKADADAIKAALADSGDMLSRYVTRVAEGSIATDQKVAFRVALLNIANVEPREKVILTIAAADVATAFQNLKDVVQQAKGRIEIADLIEQDKQRPTALLVLYIRRAEDAAVQKAVNEAGDILSRNVARAAQGENVADQKITYRIDLVSARAIEPRETVMLGVEVKDVDTEVVKLVAQVKKLGGRVVKGPDSAQDRNGKMIARMIADVPLDARDDVVDKLRPNTRASRSIPNPNAPEGKMATVRIDVTLSNESLESDDSVPTPFRTGLTLSLRGLWLSLNLLVTGLLVVMPWVLVIVAIVWVIVKLTRRATPPVVRPIVATAEGPAAPPPQGQAS